MTKLTGAALDRAVANTMEIKSVHNCENWVGQEQLAQAEDDWLKAVANLRKANAVWDKAYEDWRKADADMRKAEADWKKAITRAKGEME